MDPASWLEWVLVRMRNGPVALRAKGKTVQQIVRDAFPATGFSDVESAGSLLRADKRFVAGSKTTRWVPAECAYLVAETVMRKEDKTRLRLLRKAGIHDTDLASAEHSDGSDHSGPTLGTEDMAGDEFSRRFKLSISAGASVEQVAERLSSYGAIEKLSFRQLEGHRLFFCIFRAPAGAQAAHAGIRTGQKIHGSRVIVIPPSSNARGKLFVKPKDTMVNLSAFPATALHGPSLPRVITVTKPPHLGETPADRRVVVFGLPLEFAPADLHLQLSAFGPLDALAVELQGPRPTRRAYATFATASPAVAASTRGEIAVGDSVCRVQLISASAWGRFPWPPRGTVPVDVVDAHHAAVASAVGILRAATAPIALGTAPPAVLDMALPPAVVLLPVAGSSSVSAGAMRVEAPSRLHPVPFVPASAPASRGLPSTVVTALPELRREDNTGAEVAADARCVIGCEAAAGGANEVSAATLPLVPGRVSTASISDPRHAAAGMDSSLGAFEKHSRGFASRYLERFGFTGQLGKDGCGIALPIVAQIRPLLRGLGSEGSGGSKSHAGAKRKRHVSP